MFIKMADFWRLAILYCPAQLYMKNSTTMCTKFHQIFIEWPPNSCNKCIKPWSENASVQECSFQKNLNPLCQSDASHVKTWIQASKQVKLSSIELSVGWKFFWWFIIIHLICTELWWNIHAKYILKKNKWLVNTQRQKNKNAPPKWNLPHCKKELDE